MTNLALYFLFFFSFHFLTSSANPTNPSTTPPNFIKAACRETLYPTLCLRCLSSYAHKIQQSERQLACAALEVSLGRARSTASFVSKFHGIKGIKPREYQAVKDCIDNVGDSVEQLSQSLRELGKMNRVAGAGPDFMWHISNVQTWVSAALTDDSTCLDGFSGPSMNGRLKVAIRSRVVHVAQVTSNALALINRFARRHRRPGGSTTGLP